MKRARIAILSILLTAVCFAHGGMEHVLGTITAISAEAITVKTASGEIKTVKIVASTKITRGENAIALTDLHAGDRVAIHALKHGDVLMASEIKAGVKTATEGKTKGGR